MNERLITPQRVLAATLVLGLGAVGCSKDASPSVPTFEVSDGSTSVELGNFNGADVQVDVEAVDRQLVIATAGYTGVPDWFATCTVEEVALTGELADTSAIEQNHDGSETMATPLVVRGDCSVDAPEQATECEVELTIDAWSDYTGQSEITLNWLGVSSHSFECED
jgi:hypothetical protein